jgi:hypothetical protein
MAKEKRKKWAPDTIPQRGTNPASSENIDENITGGDHFATRQRANDFVRLMQALPDPDPILQKMGKGITALQGLLADSHMESVWGVRCSVTSGAEWFIAAGADGRREKEVVAIIPEGADVHIEALANKGSVSNVHGDYISAANAEISKAVLGQTLTTEIGDKGSYAAAKAHNLVREDLAAADRRRICAGFNNQEPALCFYHGASCSYYHDDKSNLLNKFAALFASKEDKADERLMAEFEDTMLKAGQDEINTLVEDFVDALGTVDNYEAASKVLMERYSKQTLDQFARLIDEVRYAAQGIGGRKNG